MLFFHYVLNIYLFLNSGILFFPYILHKILCFLPKIGRIINL